MKHSISNYILTLLPIAILMLSSQKLLSQLPRDTFFHQLALLEGMAFRGSVCAVPEGDTLFSGKAITLHIAACRDDSVFMHLHVGEDRSRNWIVARSDQALELRHVHRHPYGKPDAITDYGGVTTNPGSGVVQFFPADDRTHQVIPAAAGNVWWIAFTSDRQLRYHLRRLGTDRYFCLSFDLRTSIPIPPSAW